MKIKEIYNIDKVWDEIDSRFNDENFSARNDEEDRYKEIAQLSKGETPVITDEPDQEERWSNDPAHNDEMHNQSPGYRGGESAKKRSGAKYKPYNKSSEQDIPLI